MVIKLKLKSTSRRIRRFKRAFPKVKLRRKYYLLLKRKVLKKAYAVLKSQYRKHWTLWSQGNGKAIVAAAKLTEHKAALAEKTFLDIIRECRGEPIPF